MTAQLEVDLTSGVPAFEQIRAQVVAHVAAGRLVAGDRLPTIRALATDLGLAAGTVARAFRELEAEGVVETRRRAGTVIAEGASVPDGPRTARRRDVRVSGARGRADRRRGARPGARRAARASERDAHQHGLGLELDPEGRPDAVAHLTREREQVLRLRCPAVGQRERVLGRQASPGRGRRSRARTRTAR